VQKTDRRRLRNGRLFHTQSYKSTMASLTSR